tara:strand:- start:391 stop:492 length:102 start_codon:yes stop_codon:yes gene_type:complete
VVAVVGAKVGKEQVEQEDIENTKLLFNVIQPHH